MKSRAIESNIQRKKIYAECSTRLPYLDHFTIKGVPSVKELIAGHEADGFMIQNADVQGLFLVVSDDMGMFIYTGRLSQGESLESFTREKWKDMIEKAIRKPDLPVEVVDIARWQPAESGADQFLVGRVFLLGDTAHTKPAYKGLGANSGIQSAQNLGWKLAAVIHGRATQALLATCQAERPTRCATSGSLKEGYLWTCPGPFSCCCVES
jgi:2-polyprenyl-6-methoxyphenol hydroxylase-like FAD-dependent oxidoreductase